LTAAAGRRPPTPLGPPVLPGYDDLAEIGRGGGGVVYRAKEARTGRTVAVKVFRGGALASPAERERFRAEAQLAAHLRHPHVVTVYAVGGPDDLPFYAMEYLPGGSLAARLDGTPADPKAAAELVRAVAAGVEYAHFRKLVHRDLKPGNVLLDDGPGPFGTPKVSDFGTARLLAPAASPTPTQAVIGTPSYMAPEQAAGRSREVGPAADVYALGAILYELLTGRPPFRGETVLETLQQVQSRDPVPPRQLRPGLPRDLETVCLKCLEKDPRRRYATARELADDLDRFLGGRPVVARPVGPVGRAHRAARRNPAVAASLLLTAAVLVGSLAATTVLWRRAEDREEQGWEAFQLFAVAAHRLLATPDLTEREWRNLDRAAELALVKLDEAGGDPERERQVAYAVGQLADTVDRAGRRERGEELTRRAVAVLGRLAAEHPADPRYRANYADLCLQHAAVLARLGRVDASHERRREAVRVAVGLVDEKPTSDHYRTVLAEARAVMAGDLIDRGDTAGALELLALVVPTHVALLDRYPDDRDRYAMLNGALVHQARAVLAAGRPVEEYAAVARARADHGCRALLRYPDYPDRARQLLDGLIHPVHVLDHLGRREAADAVVGQVLTTCRELVGRRSDDSAAAHELSRWLFLDGWRWRGADPDGADPDGAHPLFARAAAEARRAHRLDPTTDRAVWLALVLATCPDPKVRDPARAVELARGAPGADARRVLGAALFEMGKAAAARTELEAWSAADRAGPTDYPAAYAYLALARHRTGATVEARALLQTVEDAIRNDPTVGPDARAVLERVRAEIGPPAGK
ncbi:MAG: protein kinase, partial [Gemmataceae bacterium]|nr:protein kinase [Gemmataceae bacterium]